jgi:RimJ/RimL family protein N-acetyltransferase
MDFKIEIDLKELQDFFREMNKIQKACPKSIDTERLILQREKTPDDVSTVYSILLKQTKQKIGNVTLIQNIEIWYQVYEPFRKNGYATEEVAKVMEVVMKDIDFYLSIRTNNKA